MSFKIIYNMQYDPICIGVTAACNPTVIASSIPGRAD